MYFYDMCIWLVLWILRRKSQNCICWGENLIWSLLELMSLTNSVFVQTSYCGNLLAQHIVIYFYIGSEMQLIQSKPREELSLDFRGSKDFGKDDILGHWLDILTKEKWQDILEATWNWKQGSFKCNSVYYLFFNIIISFNEWFYGYAYEYIYITTFHTEM